MDKTEIYIKMSNCPEIQESHQETTGDWHAWKRWVGVLVEEEGYIYDVGTSLPFDEDRDIWLPTQSQLQKMWIDYKEDHPDDNTFESKMDAFIYWLWGGTYRINYFTAKYSNFFSMEQLWLAFVMRQLYQKTWSGTDWT